MTVTGTASSKPTDTHIGIEPTQAPMVSVVIPTKNRAELLPRAVRSVLSQTHQKLEVIIVDDASTDNTSEVVAQLAVDKRVHLIRSATALGGGGARNLGIAAANGEFTAFLDDDDQWHPMKLERQLKFSADYSMVGCRRRVAEGYRFGRIRLRRRKRLAKPQPGTPPNASDVTLNDIYVDGGMSPTVALIRTKYLRQVDGFDASLAASQGRDLFIRLAERFGTAAMVEECLATHHVEHGLHRITDSPAHIRGGWQDFEKHADKMPTQIRNWRKCTLCLRESTSSPRRLESAKWLLRAIGCINLRWSLRYAKLFAITLLIRTRHRSW